MPPLSCFLVEKDKSMIWNTLYTQPDVMRLFMVTGGGKSSLAQTVAGKLQEGKECILVGCETTSTLQSVISDIMLNALPKDKQSGHEHRWNIGVQLGGYGANIARTHKNSSQHTDISTVSSAVHALRTLEKKHSKRPFIVIDEFDQIGSQEERAQFGALVKQLGDRASEVKLIFTGIGESLMSLIGGHKSSERQLHQIKLENLSWNGRFAIIDNAFSEFNVTVDETVRVNIPRQSRGL